MDISKEMKRVKKTLKNISEDKKPIAQDLYSQLVFLNKMLEECKKSIDEKGTIIEIVNGNQKYIKENPGVKTFNTTIQRYALIYKQYIALLPQEEQKEDDKLMLFVKGVKSK